MPISFLPTTTPGRWVVISSFGVFILLLLNPIIVNLFSLITGGGSSDNETLLTVIGAILVMLAVIALVTGSLAMVRYKERSVLVILGAVFSFVYLLFAIDTILG